MIKICIVLALLVTVSNSATKCAVNKILSSACNCAAADGGGAVISAGDISGRNYCNLAADGTTYSKIVFLASVCTDDTQLVSGQECKAGTSSAGQNICIIGQYRHGANTCNWCDIGAGAKCKTCGSTKTECDTCNAGYYYVSGTTCTAQMCSKGKYVSGKNANTAFDTCDSGKEYDSTKAAIACPSGCTDALCCKPTFTCTTAATATGCKTCPDLADRTHDDLCKTCNAGSVFATGTCTACEAGKKGAGGIAACANCAEQTFSAAGATTCTACATCGTGKKVKNACTTIANTICECKAGHGGGSCVACVAGTTFKILAGDAACTACATCGTGKKVKTACTTIANTICEAKAGTSSSMSLGVQTAVLIGMMNFV